jgi:hypothetical protein
MKALSFWKSVTMDKADFLEEVLALLRDRGIHFEFDHPAWPTSII